MSTSDDLRKVFDAARPLVDQWLDLSEEFAALRDTASAKGLDWSQIKSLLKAHAQDQRDGTGEAKRVSRIVEKAEFASAYADMLGLGANVNEKNYSREPEPAATPKPTPTPPAPPVPVVAQFVQITEAIPEFLRREKQPAEAS